MIKFSKWMERFQLILNDAHKILQNYSFKVYFLISGVKYLSKLFKWHKSVNIRFKFLSESFWSLPFLGRSNQFSGFLAYRYKKEYLFSKVQHKKTNDKKLQRFWLVEWINFWTWTSHVLWFYEIFELEKNFIKTL